MYLSLSCKGIILSGGVQPNVIPEFTELKFWLRAPNDKDLFLIKQQCTACFVAAAKVSSLDSTVTIFFLTIKNQPNSNEKYCTPHLFSKPI